MPVCKAFSEAALLDTLNAASGDVNIATIEAGTWRARHETNEAGCRPQLRRNWRTTDTKVLLTFACIVAHALPGNYVETGSQYN